MTDVPIKARLSLQDREFRRRLARNRRLMRRFSQSVAGMTRRFATLGAVAGGAAALMGFRFEQALANIAAVSRASTEELRALEQRARSLGSQTAFSASEVADAMTVLAKSGLSAKQNIESIEAVLKLAGSEMADMTQTAELMVSVMAAFRRPASDAVEVANILAAGAQNTKLSVERLADSMQLAAGISDDFALTIEETTAALGVLVIGGQAASRAGTGLARLLTELADPSEKLRAIIGDLSFEGMNLVQMLRTLEERGLVGLRIYGAMDARAARALSTFQKLGSEGLGELAQKVTETNAAWEAYRIQQDTTRGALMRFKAALEELSISLVTVFGNNVKTLLDALAEGINENKAGILTFFADVRFWAIGTARAIQAFGLATFGLIRGQFDEVSAAFNNFSTHMAALEASHAAILARIQENVEFSASRLSDILEQLRLGLQTAMPEVEEVAVSAAERAESAFRSAFAGITSASGSAADRWRAVWTSALNSISDLVADLIVQWIKLRTVQTSASVISGFPGPFGAILPFFQSGGTVPGPSGSPSPIVAHGGEEVIPEGPARRFRPILKAMTRGELPDLAGAGGGGITVHGHVHVGGGALLFAEDRISLARFADILTEEIDQRVRRTFRESP